MLESLSRARCSIGQGKLERFVKLVIHEHDRWEMDKKNTSGARMLDCM